MCWLRGWTPDVESTPDFTGCRSPAVSTPESTSQVPVLLCYLSRFRVASRGGGFPKIRPCRYRCAALRPPAYVLSPKGTGKQWLGGSSGHLAPAGPRFGLWGPPRHPSRDGLRELSSTRASPEYIQFIPSGDGFCLSENCPADTFPWDAQGYAPLASSITRCFDRLRLNRRLLRVSAMTEIPNCQC